MVGEAGRKAGRQAGRQAGRKAGRQAGRPGPCMRPFLPSPFHMHIHIHTHTHTDEVAVLELVDAELGARVVLPVLLIRGGEGGIGGA